MDDNLRGEDNLLHPRDSRGPSSKRTEKVFYVDYGISLKLSLHKNKKFALETKEKEKKVCRLKNWATFIEKKP